MRWTTKTTWLRISALLAVYLSLPAILFGISRAAHLWDTGLAMSLLILFVLLPAATIGLAAWDGMKEGFTILWVLAPVLCFLAPMFLFFNSSAFIYGAIYSVLALCANAIGALFRPRPAK
ncbi:MAG: iron ABC transporter [Arcanobacterium sp.]|nr:iron ABC transporter [Arcanobacterium sp.]